LCTTCIKRIARDITEFPPKNKPKLNEEVVVEEEEEEK
jgi:hypothetical protein